MDQNENKNMESVAEKATEVKDEVVETAKETAEEVKDCLLYTSPSPRD